MLLHDSDADPKGTLAWLQPRPQLQRHHHIRLANDKVLGNIVVLMCAGAPMLQHNLTHTAHSWRPAPASALSLALTVSRLVNLARGANGHTHYLPLDSRSERKQILIFCAQDMARLGRWMAGKAVGLVLSGGGSRGLAHLGVLHALDTAGVPVDVIGGTSQVLHIGCKLVSAGICDVVCGMLDLLPSLQPPCC